MLVTACRRGNGRDGPPIFANIFFPVVCRGFLVGFFYISLHDSLSAAESITCAFSDLSVLEKKPAFILGSNMCSDEREIFLSSLSQVKVSMFNIPLTSAWNTLEKLQLSTTRRRERL